MNAAELRQWLLCVSIALVASAVTYWGAGGAIHLWFYRRRRAEAEQWKLQPRRFLTPALARDALRLGNLNLALGSLIAGSFAWHLARGGWSRIYFDALPRGYGYLALSGVLYFFMI